jgi:type IV pilus biogenesis protein CpaD/CtpE
LESRYPKANRKEHLMSLNPLMKRGIRVVVTAIFAATIAGCNDQPQPDLPAEPQAQATPPPQPVKEGPITGHMNQGGGSALGGAKRAAENVVKQAEAASRKAAGEAEKGNDDDGGGD